MMKTETDQTKATSGKPTAKSTGTPTATSGQKNRVPTPIKMVGLDPHLYNLDKHPKKYDYNVNASADILSIKNNESLLYIGGILGVLEKYFKSKGQTECLDALYELNANISQDVELAMSDYPVVDEKEQNND